MARPRSDIRPRIVRAAREHFLSKGVDGASLRRIAREADTSIGMIYYYFPSKDDLFFAVVEEVYAALLERLAQALSEDVSVRDRIHRLYELIGRVSALERQVILLVIREALASSARLERLLDRFQRGHLPLLLRTVTQGVADGTIRHDLHPALIVMCVFALGAPPQLMRGALGASEPYASIPRGEELARQLFDIAFNGLARRGTTQPHGDPRSEGEPS